MNTYSPADIFQPISDKAAKIKQDNEIKQTNLIKLVADKIAISPEVMDNGEIYKFRLIYLADEDYYLIVNKNGKEGYNKYSADIVPSQINEGTDRYSLLERVFYDFITETSKYDGAGHEAKSILDQLLEGLNASIKDEEELNTNLSDCSPDVKKIIFEYYSNISNSLSDELEDKIKSALDKDEKPKTQWLVNYLINKNKYFIDYETGLKYERTPEGLKEITIIDIVTIFNKAFGSNKISLKTFEDIFLHINEPIKKVYHLIQWKNGVLNTKTKEFKKGHILTDCLPKLNLIDFDYFEDAETIFKQTNLYKENKAILKSDRWSWNEDLFYKIVGSLTTAINEIESYTILVGQAGTGKSTLLAILKRVFNYSEVKLQTIAGNGDFKLNTCVGKDVNIDDDLQSFSMKDIGALNTFVSGTGIEVEVKFKNERLKLTSTTTPRFFGACNILPSIIGAGHERRILLILCENVIKSKDKNYIRNIETGLRDDEIAAMLSYAIQEYFKVRDSGNGIISDEQRAEMVKEWTWKSNPLEIGVKECFIDKEEYLAILDEELNKPNTNLNSYYDNEEAAEIELEEILNSRGHTTTIKTYCDLVEADRVLKAFLKKAYDDGKIYKEGRKQTAPARNNAMEHNGYLRISKNYYKDPQTRTSKTIFVDCLIREGLPFLD